MTFSEKLLLLRKQKKIVAGAACRNAGCVQTIRLQVGVVANLAGAEQAYPD